MSATRDPLSRALDALPPAPPAPPASRVWDAIGRDARRRSRRRLTLGLAAGLACVVGAGFVAFRDDGAPGVAAFRDDGAPGVADGTDRRATSVVGEALTPDTIVVRRGGRPADATDGALRAGDDVEARDAARVRLGDRATLGMDAGARVRLVATASATQDAGRVRYDVVHDARRPFTVEAAGLRIVDVGTRFTVDVFPRDAGSPRDAGFPRGAMAPGEARVLVTVEAGEVEVDGRALRAGRGLAFVGGRPTGADWPIDARPVLALDVETANPRAGLPVVCRVTLHNPTDAWLPLPAPAAALPLVVEVVGPDGAPLAVRVTDAMRLTPRWATAIPPRGEEVVRVQFERTFASPGTYRLRAVYRPADAVEPPRSPEALLTVR